MVVMTVVVVMMMTMLMLTYDDDDGYKKRKRRRNWTDLVGSGRVASGAGFGVAVDCLRCGKIEKVDTDHCSSCAVRTLYCSLVSADARIGEDSQEQRTH